jgi:hypothetical protein
MHIFYKTLSRSQVIKCGLTNGYDASMYFFKFLIGNLLIEGTDRVVNSEKFPLLIITPFSCDTMNGRCYIIL